MGPGSALLLERERRIGGHASSTRVIHEPVGRDRRECGSDRLHLIVGEERVARDRDDLCHGPMRRVERPRPAAARERGLLVERPRVVHERLDAVHGQPRAQFVPARRPDHVEVVNAGDGRAPERGVVASGDLGAAPVLLLERAEPHAQERGLELVEPRVHTRRERVVPRTLRVGAELSQTLRLLRVARRNGAGVTEGAEVLRRVEGEAADRADGARGSLRQAKPDRLRAVLDDRNAGLGEPSNGCRTTVEVHGEDRGGPRTDRGKHRVRVDRQCRVADVHEHGFEPGAEDRHRATVRRQGRADHLAARGQVERAQGELDRIGARGNADDRRDTEP